MRYKKGLMLIGSFVLVVILTGCGNKNADKDTVVPSVSKEVPADDHHADEEDTMPHGHDDDVAMPHDDAGQPEHGHDGDEVEPHDDSGKPPHRDN